MWLVPCSAPAVRGAIAVMLLKAVICLEVVKSLELITVMLRGKARGLKAAAAVSIRVCMLRPVKAGAGPTSIAAAALEAAARGPGGPPDGPSPRRRYVVPVDVQACKAVQRAELAGAVQARALSPARDTARNTRSWY